MDNTHFYEHSKELMTFCKYTYAFLLAVHYGVEMLNHRVRIGTAVVKTAKHKL